MRYLSRQNDKFELYKEFAEKYVTLNKLEWSIVRSRLKLVTFKKGETIHHLGDICRCTYFINSGIVRSYTLDENGKDYTWVIHFNDDSSQMHNRFVADYQSFIEQKPSTLGYEVIEDCELVETGYDDAQFLYSYFKKGERFGRLMSEIAYCEVHRMIMERIRYDARSRLKRFMKSYPSLMEKVPQYHIASYLGITPQVLSKLKKELEINIGE